MRPPRRERSALGKGTERSSKTGLQPFAKYGSGPRPHTSVQALFLCVQPSRTLRCLAALMRPRGARKNYTVALDSARVHGSQEAIGRGETPSSDLRLGRETIGSYTTVGSYYTIQNQTEYRVGGLTQGGVKIDDTHFQQLVETVTARPNVTRNHIEHFLNLRPKLRLPPWTRFLVVPESSVS
jgi:hypothetical protein